VASCPTNAITLDPVRLDLGKCVFCAECTLACPAEKISFTEDPRMGAATREALVLEEGRDDIDPAETSAKLKAIFGRSLRLRQVSAGGCNGCELELNAVANVNFDLQRFGIEWVASPRHADALVLSGPLTKNMADAVRLAWDAMPEPRFVVAFGACAISGGLYAEASAIDRAFLADVAPALYVPGCPPHPLTFVHAILDLLGVQQVSRR
jgi:Ni,Fe-hydrogenase III small subunit